MTVSPCLDMATLSVGAYLCKKSYIDVPNDLFTLLRGKGGKVVEIALFSLPEAL
jgi:hypothetical protein